jgi:hypothetical protein
LDEELLREELQSRRSAHDILYCHPHGIYGFSAASVMTPYSLIAALLLAATGIAQDVTVPSMCEAGFTAGTDEALVTIPYTFDQVMSIIGSYKNLTWSGNPDDTVTLNGTDNTVGTARTYDLAGAHVIETLLTYSKPAAPGPYNEVHNTALLSVPAYNVSLYIPYDGTVVSSVCDGMASMFNFTAHFCGTNATTVGMLLHELHSGDALTVGKFLGGMNFTSCASLAMMNNGSMSSGMPMPMPMPSPSAMNYTGAATTVQWSAAGVLAGLAGLFLNL